MAEVPYNPVPTVRPDVRPPSDMLDVHPQAADFGALQGEAARQVGADLNRASDEMTQTVARYREMANATAELNAGTAASKELGDAEMQIRQLSGNNAVAALPGFQAQVQQIQDKYAAMAPNPAAKLAFLRDFHSLADRSLNNVGMHVGEQAKDAHVQALQAAIKEAQSNAVRYTATGQQPDFDPIVQSSLMLAHERGLDKDAAYALVQQNTGAAMHDMVVARVARGDVAGAQAMLNQGLAAKAPGSDLPLLDADHQASLSMMIDQKKSLDENRALTQQMRQMAFDERSRRMAAEKSADGVVRQLLTDPTQLDPGTITNDPNLSYEQKLQLMNVYHSALAGSNDTKDVKTFGPGFYDAYRLIHAAPGTPGRITDAGELYDRVGPKGDLTVAGVDKLVSELQGKRTPEGEADAKMRETMFKAAREQIVQNPATGIRDPKGEEHFLGFMASAYDAIAKGKAGGKTAADLYNPESPDYVGKLAKGFVRTPAQIQADLAAANDDLLPPGEAPKASGGFLDWNNVTGGKPDLATPEGVRAAYASGKISRQDALNLLVKAAPAAPVPGAQ